MSMRGIRWLLIGFPTAVLLVWGVVSRSAEIPFAFVTATIFGLELVVGLAAYPAVPRRKVATAATTGGVLAVLLGLPLAIVAMLPWGSSVWHVGIAFGGGAEVLPPNVRGVVAVLTLVVGSAVLCAAGAVIGHALRARSVRGQPTSA